MHMFEIVSLNRLNLYHFYVVKILTLFHVGSYKSNAFQVSCHIYTIDSKILLIKFMIMKCASD